ncbi:MAG: endo-1,4-beta-xylanase [Hyphomicrobiales bacterium]
MPDRLTCSRRDFLRTGAAATAALAAGLQVPALAAGAPAGLGALAKKAGLFFGASVADEVERDDLYRALYKREAGILTTDWALKFGNLRPDATTYDFRDGDAMLGFAREIGAPLRGHTLIWNEDRPDWLMALSNAERRRVFDAHIDKVASRYAGKLHSWDVVNEPFWPGHGLAGGFRDGPWTEAFGPDYVVRAYKRVMSVDARTRLVLNEAHAESVDELGGQIRDGIERLVDTLLDAGVRLGAVGLQGHLATALPYDWDVFGSFLERLAGRGLDIYITELDVDDSGLADDIDDRDRQAADLCAAFLDTALKVPAVKGVITWQLSDRYSWYRNQLLAENPGATRLPRPLPFDAAFEAKPMRAAIADAFARRAG